MIRTKLLALFDAVWLPALLLLATTWLYGPWLHHTHVGNLGFISAYEATDMPFTDIFRLCDILGGVLLVAVIWRAGLLRRQPWLGRLLIIIALLMIVDGLLVMGCNMHCDAWSTLGGRQHGLVALLGMLAVILASFIDAWHSKRLLSRLFLIAQIIAGALIVAGLLSAQKIAFMQYIYQAMAIVWIVYVLQRFTARNRPSISAAGVRLAFAAIVFVGGFVELTLAFHLGVYGQISQYLLLRSEPVWLAEHSVAAGVVLLYMSRYIYKGQRRAAIVIAVILMTEIIKYSLVTPNAALLLFGELSMLALWVSWPAFNRNIGIPLLSSKLKNLAVVLAGVLMAMALLFSVAASTGHGRELLHDSQELFATSAEKLKPASERGSHIQYRLTHLRYVSAGLGISLLLILLSTLFRPAGKARDTGSLPRQRVLELLQRNANSSEDYFKLWPEDKSYFTVGHVEGFIAYKMVGGTVFALADPVCAANNRQRFLSEFGDFCRQHGWSVCFILVNAESIELYESNNLKSLTIGSSAVIPIQQFVDTTVRNKWWRWQLNRAEKAGLAYEVSSPPHTPELLRETFILSRSWLEQSGHSEQGFALGYYDDAYLRQCRLHVLRNASSELVAFANQLPIYHGLRQSSVDLIRFRPDVNGAMPVLIANLLMQMHGAGEYDSFDLGFVPLAKIDTKAAAIARRLATGRFSAAGLEQFKGKFEPQWQPQYLAYDGDLVDLAALFTRLQKAMRVEP